MIADDAGSRVSEDDDEELDLRHSNDLTGVGELEEEYNEEERKEHAFWEGALNGLHSLHRQQNPSDPERVAFHEYLVHEKVSTIPPFFKATLSFFENLKILFN